MLKKELRKRYRSERMTLSAAERSKLDDLLLIQFQKLPLPPLQKILSFYPLEEKGEINTLIFTEFLAFRNPDLLVCYPKTNVFKSTMQAIVTDETTDFDSNEYGIPEPVSGTVIAAADLDAVFVPLLAFDKHGYRVGYGKGFYDRFLKSCSPDCLKIGLSYFDAVDVIQDASEFDVPLSYCITPQNIYVF